MFNCNHNGQCCEDPATQISLTLGDLQRICKFTKKSALDLYKEGVLGVYPFGNPFKNNEFETDIGLFIPCKFRTNDKKTKRKSCAIYHARPLNCRLFPFWILAEASMQEIEDFVKNHKCGDCCCIDEHFEEDRALYKKYKEKLVEILSKESPISDRFYEKLGLKKKIKTKASKTKESDLKIISKLVKKMQKEDYSMIFKRIDKELPKYRFSKKEEIVQWKDILEADA